jgi:Relaxase/Mobilisation nuclease domain
VRHISLSFAPGDVVDRLDRESIVNRVMTHMGYDDCQFIGIAHHRDDPGHDLPHDHDHLHIVVNAVDVYGQRVSDSWDRFKIQPILRDIERDFGLQPVKNSWELKQEKVHTKSPDLKISQLVDLSLVECPDLETWLDRLDESQIDVRFAQRKDRKIYGITYLQSSKAYKGSDIGASWTVVEDRIPTNTDDLPLILAANAKSQEHRMDLGEIERQNFDRAATMATAALKGRERVKTGRLDIKRDGDTLTAYRMRPHRQIFKAIETQGGWEPVGYPNIDRIDLNLLVKLSGYKDAPAYILDEPEQSVEIAELPERNWIEDEIDSYPSVAERQGQLDQTFTLLPVPVRHSVLPAEIEFDVEAITKTIHQNFADTQEQIRQSGIEYSQRLDRTFGAFMSGEQPETQGQVEMASSPQQLVDNELDRLGGALSSDRPPWWRASRSLELAHSSSISVTLKQIIYLKNYYRESLEGRKSPESIDAIAKFDIYKFQLSQHGKAVTGDPNLKMTSKFFKTFESDRVILSVADRANLEAATTFAAEQRQIAVEIAQASSLEPKQRSSRFSR